MARKIPAESIFALRRIHFNLIRSLAEASSEHCHEFFELFLVVKGQMTHVINGKAGVVRQGEVCLVRPRDIHSFAPAGEEDCSFLNLAFPQAVFAEICRMAETGAAPDTFLPLEYVPAAFADQELAAYALSVYRRICLLPPQDQSAEAEGKLLAAALLRRFPLEAEKADCPEWFAALCREMQRPEVFSAGIPGLAKASGKSAEYLSRCFRRYQGRSPMEALTALRMAYAANLLVTTAMPIVEISLECGYSSLSHFYAVFRGAYGISPAGYRKVYRIG